MRRTDALIVGGGPAGSAAAITLATGGASVRLFERSHGPHDVVCGGFLSWDTMRLLKRLDIDPLRLGARPIEMLRLVSGRRRVEVRLPHVAAGLSRRRLDEALLARAEAAGAVVTRDTSVRNVDLETPTIWLDDGASISADALFLATGKHELRGAARLAGVERKNAAVGLRVALQPSTALEEALAGTLELHLFDGGYAGLLTQEDGSVNLCLSTSRGRLHQAGGVEPMLEQLALEQPLLGQWLAERKAGGWATIAGVPYGWRARQGRPGIFQLGDQAAVISSLAGDGIGIALKSGIDAAGTLLASGPDGGAAFQRKFAAEAASPLKVADILRWSAEHPKARGPFMSLLGAAPGLARLAAKLTRIE